jgi:hypothetical protein
MYFSECTKPNLKKPILQLSAYWGALIYFTRYKVEGFENGKNAEDSWEFYENPLDLNMDNKRNETNDFSNGDFSVLDGLKVSPKWYDYFGIFSPPLYLSIGYYNAVRFNLKEQRR